MCFDRQTDALFVAAEGLTGRFTADRRRALRRSLRLILNELLAAGEKPICRGIEYENIRLKKLCRRLRAIVREVGTTPRAELAVDLREYAQTVFEFAEEEKRLRAKPTTSWKNGMIEFYFLKKFVGPRRGHCFELTRLPWGKRVHEGKKGGSGE